MTDWPDDLNAYRFFLADRIAEGRGNRVALRCPDHNLSYLEVDHLASRYASALAGLGVAKEARVLVVMPDGADFVGAFFGILRLGAVVVMVNPELTPEGIRGIVGAAGASAAVVHHLYSEIALMVEASEVPVLSRPSEPDEAADVGDPATTGPEDTAIWLFSGGTTGAPKAVEQTHRSLVNTTRLYGQGTLALTEDDITISVPKLFFGYATGSNLLFPFSVGASAVLSDAPSTPENLFDLIVRHRPTVLVNVPSAINQMLNHPGASEVDMSSLRLATSAGEALPESLYHRWVDTFGVELLDGLGTAEMWHIFVSNRPGRVRPGTLGQVVPGFEIKVCDDEGVELPSGEVGRLWVKGESLGKGYWGDPERTAEAFRPPWFVGGDLVSIDGDGYVTHRGRADDAIKVKGKWFRPQELESVLLEHPAVVQCAVVAVEDSAGLASPVAFVVSSGLQDEQELVDWSLSRLEPYKRPRKVHFVDRLPQTHLGKVDRAALKRSAG